MHLDIRARRKHFWHSHMIICPNSPKDLINTYVMVLIARYVAFEVGEPETIYITHEDNAIRTITNHHIYVCNYIYIYIENELTSPLLQKEWLVSRL